MIIDYDIETFKPIFTAVFKDAASGMRWIFEVSDRVDQSREFCQFLWGLKARGDVKVCGYNNEHFDWSVCQYLMELGSFTALDAYNRAQQIISGDMFDFAIWPDQRHIAQIDLFKIHHFDNFARSTSLKALEIAMRSSHIEDLPFDPHVESVTWEQCDEVIVYNCHDVDKTAEFREHSMGEIGFREELSERYGIDMTNFNDTKIGKEYFIMELEKALPGCCFDTSSGRKMRRQTPRPTIDLNDAILPDITFRHPEFHRVITWMRSQVIKQTKGAFENIVASIDGFDFHFGLGGIHGSRQGTFEASATHKIIDVDVASFYPSLAIANRFYPAHLSETFCDIYAELFAMRRTFPKSAPENKMLKLALNGVYGDSNSKYSPFYDPLFTMQITTNGQLLLCKLAETIMGIPDLTLIQINTDGMTALVPIEHEAAFHQMCRDWETATNLTLEDAHYTRMMVRDVNNYIAVYENGDVKRKGQYDYNPLWHQNQSSLVVPKAVSAYLIDGIDPTEFIYAHPDHFDFCITAKVPRSSRLVTTGGETIQNTTRYHIAYRGEGLIKQMPPLPKKPDEWRNISIDKGWSVNVCNDIACFDWDNLNREYYIQKATDLINGVTLNQPKGKTK